MLGLNKILLVGTVGRNPETRYISSGFSFARFSMVTRDNVTNHNGTPVEEVEWHEIVAHGNCSGYVSQYVKKGDLVYVEGKLKSRYVADGEGGGHRIFEVMAQNVSILSRSKANADCPNPEAAQPAPDTQKVGYGLPGFDIENIPVNLKGDDDGLPF